MFHLIMILTVAGQQVPLRSLALHSQYPTRQACLADGNSRAVVIAQAKDVHGRYLCMYRHESDAALAHETKVEF